MRLNKLTKIAVSALEDIKARDIVVLDVRKMTSLYDTLIIATADSARQTKALASHLREDLRAAGATILGSEGEETGEWVLVDCGDLVVHIMQPAVRAYYNLEELWTPPKPVRTPRAKVANGDEAVAKKSATKTPTAKKTAASAQPGSATMQTTTKPVAAKKVAAKKTSVKGPAAKKTAAKTLTQAASAAGTRRRLKASTA